jgi:hypothetical protein
VLINEITEPNDVWRILNEVRTDFEEEFAMISKLLQLLINQKSHSRNLYYLKIIEAFEHDLNLFIKEPFPDNTDSDLLNIKHSAHQMLDHIANEKAKLNL